MSEWVNEPTVVRVLLLIAVAMAALLATLGWIFVVRFSRVDWWKTAEGRHLMKFSAGFSMTFTLSVVDVLVGFKPVTKAVLSIMLFGWLAWELANRIRLQGVARREVEDEARDQMRDAPRDTGRDANRDARRDPPRDGVRDAARDGRDR